MNILQILPALEIGGVETGTIDLVRYLVKHGHKAVVVSGGGVLVKELEKIGARHYELPVGRKSPVNIFMMVDKLAELIRREDIDIVHARSRVPAIIAYFACKITNRVLITTAHGYYRKHLLSESMGWGKFVIVASNIMAKHMSGAFRVPYDKIRLIPRGVDLAKFPMRKDKSVNNGEFVIGIVSRITPLKGHADFIKAISIVKRRIPGLKALIVGSASKDKYRDDLELLAKQLGISDTVEFAGARHDIPEVMRGLDLLVSSTITPEAFGRVIIEAQAIGVPVVATNVGGVVDIVEDGRTGLLCEPQNPKDIADKIFRLYKDKKMADAVVVSARKRVEKEFGSELMMQRTIAVYEEALKKQNILVIKMSAIGDVILSVPSLRAIRSRYPGADIKVLVSLSSREALDGCPYINGRIVCDFNGKHKGLEGLWLLSKELRAGRFEVVIDLQNNRKSHILAFLSFAQQRYGYDNGKLSFLLNRRIKDDAPHLDPIDHQFRTLRLAGIKPADKSLALWPSAHDEAEAGKFLEENWLKSGQNVVGINVRASKRWASKNWPASRIVEFCDRLARECSARVVLTGTEEDIDFARDIAGTAKSKPIVAAGKTTVMELAALIKRLNVYVTPDSAPMHVACAVGTPCIALFGPTDPTRHVAPSDRCTVIYKGDQLTCSPCYKPECARRLVCMYGITVDDVLGAVKGFLKKEVTV